MTARIADEVNLNVELDVTPSWWSRYGGQTLSPKYPDNANLIAKAMMMAVELFPGGVTEIRVTRSHLRLLTRVPPDVSLGTIRARGIELVKKLNEFELPSLP